jgi:hypothetical protein
MTKVETTQTVANSQTFATWLTETRAKLNGQSVAVAEALDDLGAAIGDHAPPTWVDAPTGVRVPPEEVNVYVLTGAVLHHITGWSDLQPNGYAYMSACRARSVRITGNDRCDRVVKAKAQEGAVYKYATDAIQRSWTFRVGEDDPIVIPASQRTAEGQKSDDPTRFAQALTEAIMSAQAREQPC